MWAHFPGLFGTLSFDSLLTEIQPLVGKNASRESCVLVSPGVGRPYPIPQYSWETSSLVSRIKEYLESNFQTKFDYCLVHIYTDGNSTINWHNDKESLFEDIMSVSFGATRKFRLRELGETKGWYAEYELGHGDLFHMKRGCQMKYEHTVPKQSTITQPRINLTFRKVDLIAEALKS